MSDAPRDGLDERLGSVLAGRYRIVRKLGEGAMGEVYLGEHIKIGRQDAIKVLRGALSSDAEAIARFTRGARNVAAIQHPNVCTIYDYGDTQEGLPFLAMEFIAGLSLKEVLEAETRLPLPRAIHIARQVADALQAAHDAQIVHRDLKPANIMITPDRNGKDAVRVVDFDIAKGARDTDESELTRLGFVVGTPEYMSPEQLMGERLSGRSDVYSLGLVLFRMLTGALPFRADSAQELMIQRLTTEPLRLDQQCPGESAPAELQRLLDAALARKASDRPSAEEFARALEQTASPVVFVAPPGQPAPELAATRVSSSPAPAIDAPPAASRPNRVAVAVGLGLTLALVGAAGGAMLLRGGGPGSSASLEPAPESVAQATRLDGFPEPVESSLIAPAGAPEAEPREPVSTVSPDGRPASVATREPAPPAPAQPIQPDIRPETATAILWHQLDLLGPPYPDRATLAAVRDSALAVWRLDGSAQPDRALAAYIVGSAWYALGNTTECATWINRALGLRPDGPGYREMLTNCEP